MGVCFIKKSSEYSKYASRRAKPSPIYKNCARAFLVGGIICLLAQIFSELYSFLSISQDTVKVLVPITMIFLASLATGFGFFDNIAKFGGAGALLPITGFSNAVTSPAIDSKNEGWILGLGAKIFTVAGPVILYGTVASVIYGVIYWAIKTLI